MRYTARKVRIPSKGGSMKLLVLAPESGENRPGVLWIHGSGYVTGMAGMVWMSRAKNLVARFGAVVVSPEYRLAGKAPYPAALCLYERDVGGVRIAFQLPLYPMLDNEDTVTSRDNHAPVWNTRLNHYGWARYLRGLPGGPVPAYAAAARAKDFSSLPPAYTFVSTREPFYAETLAYVENLRRAGVEATVDVYPGLFHAFDMLLPFLKVSRQAAAAFEAHFESALRRSAG